MEGLHDPLLGLAAELGVKNGQVLWPVRVAISGVPVTPGGAVEVAALLGKEETLRRMDVSIEKLKKALGNFFTNLSPGNRLAFGVILTVVVLALVTLLCTTLSKGATNPVLWKIVWVALLILFGIGEAVTVGLTSIWFAAGALAALVVALLNGPLWLQIVLFLLISLLSLLAIRPLASKYLNSKVEPTNADRIIGAETRVVEPIDNLQATGAVRISGMVWSARSENDTPIPEGTLVRVLRIEGVKVYVEEIKEEVKCQS